MENTDAIKQALTPLVGLFSEMISEEIRSKLITPHWVDEKTFAQHLGKSRQFVYLHRQEFNHRQIGDSTFYNLSDPFNTTGTQITPTPRKLNFKK